MELNRRDFLKLSGASMVGAVALASISEPEPAAAAAREFPLANRGVETSTICCYCSVGCGAIVTRWQDEHGERIRIEGDPDHPVNSGAACAKGASMRQLSADNPWRLSKPLYRAPGATDWEEKSWDWALDNIARRIKDTRDASVIERDSQGDIVNRTEAIANLGGSALDNEECYLLAKMTRALGVVYLEHHARI